MSVFFFDKYLIAYHKVLYHNDGQEFGSSEVFFLIIDLNRFYGPSFDSVNVAEELFAIAIIVNFPPICFLLSAIQYLGPLQISLGRMMSDIGKFTIIFLIILYVHPYVEKLTSLNMPLMMMISPNEQKHF